MVIILATSAGLATAAPWEPKGKAARARLGEGADAFDAADYPRAAALFLQAWSDEPANVARLNAGQAFAAAGDWRHAIEQFDQLLADKDLPRWRRAHITRRRRLAHSFTEAEVAIAASRLDEARTIYLAILAEPQIDPLDREHATKALDRIAELRAAAVVAPRPPDPEREPLPVTPSQPTSSASTSALPPPPPPPVPPSRLTDTAALVVLGGGAVVAAFGAGFLWHTGELDDDSRAPGLDERSRAALADRAGTWRTIGAVSLAAGGATLIVGAIKLAIPQSAPTPRSAMALYPMRGGAAVVIGGRF